ncbi:hypothetical protein QZN30_17415 [Burkholderia multivorans]|nr:hypothetical protein [Burkholderia multivorans]
MAVRKDITPGQRFHRLTVLQEAAKREGSPHRRVTAICDCGDVRDYVMAMLRSGKTKSCGCFAIDSLTKHGHARTNTPTYRSWTAMKSRCDPDHGKPEYAGSGISVCLRWLESFENFLADMGERPKGTTLDRFPNGSGNYEPGNCRWATPSEQANNRGNQHLLSAHGKTMTIMEWANKTGIPFQTIRHRLLRGWSAERSVSAPE